MSAAYERESTTFDLIRHAACTLFGQAGYKGVGMRQLAAEVGIQVGSLYNHIESKQSLLYELINDYEIQLLHVFKSRSFNCCETAVQMNALLWDKVSAFIAHNGPLAQLSRNEVQHLSQAQAASISRIRLCRRRQLRSLLNQSAGDIGLSSEGLDRLAEELYVLLDCHIGLDANMIDDPNGTVRRQLRSMASMLLVRRD